MRLTRSRLRVRICWRRYATRRKGRIAQQVPDLFGPAMSLRLTLPPDEIAQRFRTLQNRADVAQLLDIDEERLIYHLYIVRPSQKYEVFRIPKRRGGYREIAAPITALKILQQKLNQVLQQVYRTKAPVHGFAIGKNIVTNAQVHARQRYVLNVDLLDFFPSIHFGRIRGMFMAEPYNLNPEVAMVLAQICCYDGRLPQGAPTSPILSNMICSRLDTQMRRLAQSHRCIYTRYADDITLSTSLRSFPSSLASRSVVTGQTEAGPELSDLIQGNGFWINPHKVRLQTRSERQEVTGLTVNRMPNVQRRYIRQIRAMLYAWHQHGYENAEGHFLTQYDRKHRHTNDDERTGLFRRVVKGKIDFLGMVRGTSDPIYLRFRDQLRDLDPSLVRAPSNPLAELDGMFDELMAMDNSQRRGYLLQDLLRRLFELSDIPMDRSFTRNEGAEQIDGAFTLEGSHYLVEARWRTQLANIREVDGLHGQVMRSGVGTLGLFLSINGWSENVPKLLTQNPDKSIMLMGMDDLRAILRGEVAVQELLAAKLNRLTYRAEPYYGASDYLRQRQE